MTADAARLAASYAVCRRIARDAQSSFTPAFRLLSPPQRQSMNALYAFFRLTDDLSDEQQITTAPDPVELAARTAKLDAWEQTLCDCLARIPTSQPGIFPALADTVNRFQIPTEPLFDVIYGVRMDIQPKQYDTWDELVVYLDRVASAVGLACLPVWGIKSSVSWEAVEPPALAAGRAFQLTNILRDVAEDAARGRCYFPRVELEQFHATWPLAHTIQTRDFFEFQIARAERLYQEAFTLGPLLSREGRAIFLLMAHVYHELLQRIKADPMRVLGRRIRLSRWKKAGLLLQAYPMKWGWV